MKVLNFGVVKIEIVENVSIMKNPGTADIVSLIYVINAIKKKKNLDLIHNYHTKCFMSNLI